MLKKNKGSPRTKAGFMLLEVILSVFVVTVGVVFVTGAFITSIKAFKASRIYANAVCLLENRMWEYEEKGNIEDGREAGKFDDYENAEWEIEAKELDDMPLNETSAEVIIDGKGTKTRFKVVTYFYRGD